MASLIEADRWEEEILQLERKDFVEGGVNGIDNVQARQLANRTRHLKRRLDEIFRSGNDPLFRFDIIKGHLKKIHKDENISPVDFGRVAMDAKVEVETPTEYILRIKTRREEWLTPNLRGGFGITPPVAPTGLAAETISRTSIKVTWEPVIGATHYRVFYGTDNETFNSITTSELFHKFEDLELETTYYFKVKAISAFVEGEASDVVSATMKLTEIPFGSERNLALRFFGREVTGPQDVTELINAVYRTIANGNISNLNIGDFFGLASIDIPNGSTGHGAFSATLSDMPGGDFGRNLDFVLVSRNGYVGVNGNSAQHVVFQSRHVLSAMTGSSAGGHPMNAPQTSAGGYPPSAGRAFVINQVKNALLESGIPVNDESKIITLSRRSANAGNGPNAMVTIEDNVFIPTEFEIRGSHHHSSPVWEPASTQAHFEFYNSAPSRIKRRANGEGVFWWQASPAIGVNGFFSFLNGSGGATHGTQYHAAMRIGIAPAFAVGSHSIQGDGDMFHIAIDNNGKAATSKNISALHEKGLEPVKSIDAIEFRRNGHTVRVIDGELHLGPTHAELEERAKQAQISSFKQQLEAIDNTSGATRSVRDVSVSAGVVLDAVRVLVARFARELKIQMPDGFGAGVASAADILAMQPPEGATLKELDDFGVFKALLIASHFDPRINPGLTRLIEAEAEAAPIRKQLADLTEVLNDI